MASTFSSKQDFLVYFFYFFTKKYQKVQKSRKKLKVHFPDEVVVGLIGIYWWQWAALRLRVAKLADQVGMTIVWTLCIQTNFTVLYHGYVIHVGFSNLSLKSWKEWEPDAQSCTIYRYTTPLNSWLPDTMQVTQWHSYQLDVTTIFEGVCITNIENDMLVGTSVAAAQAGHFATLRNKIVKKLKIFMEIDYLRSQGVLCQL